MVGYKMVNSMHIKLEYPEAVALKKEALLFEASLIKAIERIRDYDALRKREFALKSQVKKDLVILKNLISSVELMLPKDEVKAILGTHNIGQAEGKAEKGKGTAKVQAKIRERKMGDLEFQLREIKEKLARLG